MRRPQLAMPNVFIIRRRPTLSFSRRGCTATGRSGFHNGFGFHAAIKPHSRSSIKDIRRSRRTACASWKHPSPFVPKGQNMNSRGRSPRLNQRNTFDPEGVAPFFPHSPWVCTHGYSGRATSRPGLREVIPRIPRARPGGDLPPPSRAGALLGLLFPPDSVPNYQSSHLFPIEPHLHCIEHHL